jgi:thiol-disulfide isomerase/thioredoxin
MPRRTNLRAPMIGFLALAALVLGGCAGDGAELASEPSPAASTSSAESPAPQAGAETGGGTPSAVPTSLDFTGTTVAGDAFEGESLAGRPTLLWFWAPWCPTCRGQIPQVEGIAAEHAGELNVIGVGSLDSAEAIAGFAEDVDDVVHLEDVDGELWKRFGVTEQSSFVLLDADGAVVFEAGYGGTDDLGAQVDDVVG